MDLDEFELVDSPTMQLDESQENVGVGPAPTTDTESTSGLAPRNGSMEELRPGVDPCQESSPPFSRLIFNDIHFFFFESTYRPKIFDWVA